MKKILLNFSFLILISCVGSIAMFILKYPERFDDLIPNNTQSPHSDKYLLTINKAQPDNFVPPILPDVSIYTTAALKQKIPEMREGDISVEPLEKGYSFVRSQTAFYGDLQSRLDPIAIVVRSGVISLEDIVNAVSDPKLIRQEADGRFMLYVPLAIREDATLIINNGQTLLMSADQGAILPVYGGLHVLDAYIMGWDMGQDQPAYYKNAYSFRPYIIAWCGSEVNIGKSYLGYLGYDAPKAYGLTYSSCKNDKYVAKGASLQSGTGWLVENEFEQLYFGFYSYETDRAVITGNIYRDNIVYGIDPHDYSTNLIIAHNVVTGTRRKHGIIISRGVGDSYIFRNKTSGNAGSGLMIDRHSSKNIIAHNQSYNNGGDGIAVYESSYNILFQNSFSHNEGTGIRIRNSTEIISYNDKVNSNKDYAVELYTEELQNRDLERDPYQKNSSFKMSQPEIIRNYQGVFKTKDFDRFDILSPKIFDVQKTIFSGDLKGLALDYFTANQDYSVRKR